MSNVFYLHGHPQPLSQFLRIGSGHTFLDQALAAGRMPIERIVVDAGTFAFQAELVETLRQEGKELSLDTNCAELSVPKHYEGSASGAPWAIDGSMLSYNDFDVTSGGKKLASQIAEFVMSKGFQRVHSPTHLISGINDPWFRLDISFLDVLRKSLDSAGGKNVAVDYPLIIGASTFIDAAQRRSIIDQLSAVDFNSIWLRISGLGADSTPARLRKIILASLDIHSLERPMVADRVGGMVGQALLAFGSVAGISHGVASKERFSGSDWHKPRRPGGGGGGGTVLLNGIDRLLKLQEAETFISHANGRRVLSCNDRLCCQCGFDDTKIDSKGHYIRQKAKQIRSLSLVPDQMRIKHFINSDLIIADRISRVVSKFKLSDPALVQIAANNAKRLGHMREVLEELQATIPHPSRSISLPEIAANRNSHKRVGS